MLLKNGLHTSVIKENRLCKRCCSDIEDEFHFVLKCPQYKELRLKYIKKYYREKLSVLKSIQLLTVKNYKESWNLKKHLNVAFNNRNGIL